MKLALIADSFPPLRTSGAVQLRDLSREIVRQGHALTVIVPDPEIRDRWSLDTSEGMEVLRLSAPRTRDINYVRRTFGEWLMPHIMLRNLRLSPLAEVRWDGLMWYSPSIFHAPLVRALKHQSNCRGYLIIRDIFPEWAADLGLMRKGFVYHFFKAVAQKQYEVADTIGVQSAGNLSYFDKWCEFGRGRELEVLENWLGTPTADQCPIRVGNTILAGRKIFVYAGNMGVAQGMDILMDLAERMRSRRDLGFLFVGRGSEAGRLQRRAKEMGLDNVVFSPEIAPDEIPSLYAQCHAGIVSLDPRHRSHNIPGKLLSYLQCSLPVLASVNSGNDLAELIRRESVGQVCETNKLDDLELCCIKLLLQIETDVDLQARCNRLFHQKFSVVRAVRQIVRSLSRGQLEA